MHMPPSVSSLWPVHGQGLGAHSEGERWNVLAAIKKHRASGQWETAGPGPTA